MTPVDSHLSIPRGSPGAAAPWHAPSDPSDDGPAPRPNARGECSAALLELLHRAPGSDAGPLVELLRGAVSTTDIRGDDLQLSLWVLYALHLHGLEAVDEAWEWDPGLVAAARVLEDAFEQSLRAEAYDLIDRARLESRSDDPSRLEPVRAPLLALTRLDLGPSMSRWIATRANLAQVREFLVLKSIYQLKEADPHTFAIPRLQGRAKAAAVEIQADEYGGGDPPAVHAALFARAMREAGLSDRIGGYVDHVPASVLAADNAAVMFGLHRRLRGAIVGHLAAIEMTSTIPMRRYAAGIARVGLSVDVAAYFHEHVMADAAHEQVALHDLVRPFVRSNPARGGDVLFGAAAAMMLDAAFAREAITAWEEGRSALRARASEPWDDGSGPERGFWTGGDREARTDRSPTVERAAAPDAGPAAGDEPASAEGPVSTTGITVCQDGPLLVRGPVPITRTDGGPVEATRRTIALCRCGRSGTKPHCDGTHHKVGFTAP